MPRGKHPSQVHVPARIQDGRNLVAATASGPPGPTGPSGVSGAPGTPGADGFEGEIGEIGAPGPTGLNGVNGLAGIPGPPGFDGADGVDGDSWPLNGGSWPVNPVVISNTDTGTLNDWNPGTLFHITIIEWSGASDATITGIAGRASGKIVLIKNTGTKIAYFPHAGGGSAAGNRLNNIVTSGSTPVAPGGSITYVGDGTDWKLAAHVQGTLITATYNAGDFTATGGDASQFWTVDSGDITVHSWQIRGKLYEVSFDFSTTSVGVTSGGLPTVLNVKIQGGFTVKARSTQFAKLDDAGTNRAAATNTSPSIDNTVYRITTQDGASYTAATHTTRVRGLLAFEVD